MVAGVRILVLEVYDVVGYPAVAGIVLAVVGAPRLLEFLLLLGSMPLLTLL
jgi:hypothetical protein